MTNSHTATGAAEFLKAKNALVRNIATIVVLAILLGLGIQLAILLTRIIFGADLGNILPESAGSISWAVIVCFGVTAGTTIRKSGAPVAAFISFICAPIALAVAKGAQRGLNQLMGIEPEQLTYTLLLVAAIKAVQYGCLAFVLNMLVQREIYRLPPYAWVGIGAGATFGALNVIIRLATANPSPVEIATNAVNELLFPLGCAVAVYVASAVARAASR